MKPGKLKHSESYSADGTHGVVQTTSVQVDVPGVEGSTFTAPIKVKWFYASKLPRKTKKKMKKYMFLYNIVMNQLEMMLRADVSRVWSKGMAKNIEEDEN